jgi:hypothetical protein
MSAELAEMMNAHAGEGISTNPNDFLISMIYILQPQSPQALRDNEAFIEGAEPGHIYLKGAISDPLQGDIWFQPCLHYRKWVEWIPRKQGGGFVASYDHPGGQVPPVELKAQPYRDPDNPNVQRWKINGSNDLIDTQYYVGHIVEEDGTNPREYIIPLASTGHTFGKKMMSAAKNRPVLPSGRPPSLFLYQYHIVTEMKSNQAGEWYIFDFPDPTDEDGTNVVRKVPQELYAKGRQLAKAFGEGALRADYSSQQFETSGAGSDDRAM